MSTTNNNAMRIPEERWGTASLFDYYKDRSKLDLLSSIRNKGGASFKRLLSPFRVYLFKKSPHFIKEKNRERRQSRLSFKLVSH